LKLITNGLVNYRIERCSEGLGLLRKNQFSCKLDAVQKMLSGSVLLFLDLLLISVGLHHYPGLIIGLNLVFGNFIFQFRLWFRPKV